MVLVVAIGIAIWSVFASGWMESWFLRWLLRVGQDRPGRTALIVVGLHLGSLLVWFLVAGASSYLVDSSGQPETAGWVTVPMLLAYGPFALLFVPSMYTLFRLNRDDFERRGASRGTARAAYWTGLPFGLIGLCICCAAFLATFVND